MTQLENFFLHQSSRTLGGKVIFPDSADGNLIKVLACMEWPHRRWFPGFGWEPVSGYFTTLGEVEVLLWGPRQHCIYWEALPSHAIVSETNEISSFLRNHESSLLVRISRSLRSALKCWLHQMCWHHQAFSSHRATHPAPCQRSQGHQEPKNTVGLQMRTRNINAIPIEIPVGLFFRNLI